MQEQSAPERTEPARVQALGGSPWAGVDAAEAHRVTLGQLGGEHWPVLPELPDRGPGADAVGRSAALLHEVSVDLQPHGWRVSPPGAIGSGMDRRRALSFLREDAHRWADTAGAEGAVTERLAVRVRGPLSLLGALWLPGGERVLIDAGARRDVAESQREGLVDALVRLRETTGARRLGVVLDEPWTAAVLAGTLPTASGYRTVRSLRRDEARTLWRDLLEALTDRAEVQDVWLAPAPRESDVADLAVLASEALPAAGDDGAQPVRLVLPVGVLEAPAEGPSAEPATPAAWEVVAGWMEAGRRVALSPAGPAPLRPAGVLETWDRLGLDPALAHGLTLTAPGLHDARTLGALRRDAEELDARVHELLG